MKRLILLITSLVLVFVALFGYAIGWLTRHYPDMQRDALIHRLQRRPDIATLQTITASATTDEAAYAAIAAYYETKQDYLRVWWHEDNPARLKALFVMYAVHISHSYGPVPELARTLLDYLRKQPMSHCGTLAVWQRDISRALGLNARTKMWTSGNHGWAEVEIDGTWEVFDATTMVWISADAATLLKGGAREYRAFYAVLNDEGVRWLRDAMPAMGITYAETLTDLQY